jgi:hypothetical protein
MWKPGQSGNPAGVSKAYAEAMREISMRGRELSLGAERTRRWRQKRRQGVAVVRFDVAPDITAKLICLGWLDATKRGDKEAIATAFIELAEKATQLGGDASVALDVTRLSAPESASIGSHLACMRAVLAPVSKAPRRL